MKLLPENLEEHLQSGATTMVHCWRIIRPDGVEMGFTEHDRDLTFNGLTYSASSGFSATTMDISLGLSTDNLEADGALSSEAITDEDISAGRYDDAEVEVYWVNHQDTEQRILLTRGFVGRVTRGELAYSAEVRSQTSRLQQPTGRTYQRVCDAILGDKRCGVDLSEYRETVTVTQVERGRVLKLQGLQQTEREYYSLGTVRFLSGDNESGLFEVKSHSGDEVELWQEPTLPVNLGDRLEVTAGCNKFFKTCGEKFGNKKNFRGFPHVPGSDHIAKNATRSGGNGGQSIFNN